MTKLRRGQAAQVVKDYEFRLSSGKLTNLVTLFGDKQELFVVHNMGRKCPYCTLWADGFNGILPHLKSRAAFVLSSPDTPEIQAQFSASRSWEFDMVSTAGTTFAVDLGYQGEGWLRPGVSVFTKSTAGEILRVSDTEFGPGDDYCQLWSLFDLLPSGADDWHPKFAYRSL
jgi:predicted dithiol-disulfide oxidoreductase (DUF899 family)